MTIRLRQLEAFRATARHGGMTRAAEALGVSQPAVSRLLRSFADTVGFELFERDRGRLIPTRESRYLLVEVERLLESLGQIEEMTQDLTARTVGHLRIACLPGFATSHLPSVLARFLADRPGVTATVEPDRPERILDWIIGQQYDFGVTDGFAGHPAVEARPVLMRTVCILPKGHALAAKTAIRPEDLAHERMIHTRRDSAFFRELERAFAATGVRIPSWVEIRQFTSACMLVAEGAGVSIVSEMDAREHENRGLVLRPFAPETPHRLSLLRPTHTPPSLITLEFIEAFEDSLKPFMTT